MTFLLGIFVGCEATSYQIYSHPLEVEPPEEPPREPSTIGDAPTDTGGWDPDAPLPVLVAEVDSFPMPDVRVGTRLEAIVDHDGTLADLADAPRFLETTATLEGRGASSAMFPKRSFNLELQDESGADRAVALFGMPPEADWILYGPYTDKTFVRDALTYGLARRMGGYAPRVRFSELVIGGVYLGIYQVTEKPELDPDRVALPEPTDGLDLTGGYLFKYEGNIVEENGWRSARDVGYQLGDPGIDEITEAQLAYLSGWMDDFEEGIARGDDPAAWIDVTSFADFTILTELSRNVDGYRRSALFHKAPDKLGGKLHAGPLWDFNLAWGNADYCDGWNVDGLAFERSAACPDWAGWHVPEWWSTILHDPRFTAQLRCRWEALRLTVLSDAAIAATIDALVRPLAQAEPRDHALWETLGRDVWPNYYVGETWADELAYLLDFATTRAAWLDANLPGTCEATVP